MLSLLFIFVNIEHVYILFILHRTVFEQQDLENSVQLLATSVQQDWQFVSVSCRVHIFYICSFIS